MRCAVIISTTQDIHGRAITDFLGLAHGNSVRARQEWRDIMAALQNIIGGEISDYAKSIQAGAIVSVRYTTSMIATGASEILA
jgi:uncharacterized protein YbjQ (UPF0145 family)